MTNALNFLAGTVGAAVAITGLAIVTPAPAQADEAARQFEQSYCFTAIGADRWKACR